MKYGRFICGVSLIVDSCTFLSVNVSQPLSELEMIYSLNVSGYFSVLTCGIMLFPTCTFVGSSSVGCTWPGACALNILCM